MIHNKCKIIGLTGGIASGKSTASQILKDQGFQVIDADKIAREIVEINKPAYRKIIKAFGEDILKENKEINRKKLGQLVFSNPKLLKKLNKITHPFILREIKKQIDKKCERNKLIFVDIPLLFEIEKKIKKHNIIFDEIWLIYVDEYTQIKRLMKRNNFSKEEAKERIKSQLPMEIKKEKSTKIIDNRGHIETLRKNIKQLLKNLPQ